MSHELNSTGDFNQAEHDGHEGVDPELQQTALKLSLEQWSRGVIDDPDISEAILNRLNEDEPDEGLPKLSIAPHIKANDSGTVFSLQIMQSREGQFEIIDKEKITEGVSLLTAHGVKVGYGLLKYIKVVEYDHDKNALTVLPDLARAILGGNVDNITEEQYQRVIESGRRYFIGVQELLEQLDSRGVDWSVDRWGRIKTISELSQMYYLPDDEHEVGSA